MLIAFVRNLATNLDELTQRAAKFMQIEELRDFRNKVRADGRVEKKHTEREGGQ